MSQSRVYPFVIWANIWIGAALLLLPRDWFPTFYAPVYMGVFSFVCAALIAIVPYILKTTDPEKIRMAHRVRVVLTVMIVLNALGELGLYQMYHWWGFQFDKVLHLIIPLVGAATLVQFFRVWYGTAQRVALLRAIGIVIFGLLAWELWEFISDLLFKTKLFGIYGEVILADTLADIGIAFVGIFIVILMNIRRLRLPRVTFKFRRILGNYGN